MEWKCNMVPSIFQNTMDRGDRGAEILTRCKERIKTRQTVSRTIIITASHFLCFSGIKKEKKIIHSQYFNIHVHTFSQLSRNEMKSRSIAFPPGLTHTFDWHVPLLINCSLYQLSALWAEKKCNRNHFQKTHEQLQKCWLYLLCVIKTLKSTAVYRPDN